MRDWRVWGNLVMALAVGGLALGLRLYRFELPHTSALTALQAGTLPPGLHWDEAVNDIAALRLVREGGFAPFLRIDLGRMPLHIYLVTLVFAMAGPLAVGGRLAALVAGLLNLLVIGLLARRVFATALSDAEGRVLAWFVTAQMAVTYWFVHFNRLGMEHSALAFFSTLAMLGLWWAAARPTPARAAVAGGLLGLAIYSYPAAYALPLAGFGVLGHLGAARRPARATALRFGAAYAVAFVMVLMPLALFFLRYPEWILKRPAGVGVDSLGEIVANLWGAVGGLLWHGDPNTSYNLPGRPFFDGVQAALFLIGAAVCVRHVRRPPYAVGLLWLGVMLLPQAFTEAPHFGRMAGATVPAVLIAGLGGVTLWRMIRKLSRSPALASLALGALTLANAGLTARDYFLRWPQTPDLYPTFRVAERLEAELARQIPPGGPVYLSPIDWDVPTIRYVLDDKPEEFVRPFNGRECTILPSPTTGAHYLVTTYEDSRTPERLLALYGTAVTSRRYPPGGPNLVTELNVPAGQARALPEGSVPVAGVSVGGLLKPLAVIVSQQIDPAASVEVPVTLVLETTGRAAEDLILGLYLLGPDFPGPNSRMVGQVDRQPCDNSYPTSRWVPGEWIVEDRRIPLPSDVPPGWYTLALALYRYPSLERLPVTDSAGRSIGDLAALVKLPLGQP